MITLSLLGLLALLAVHGRSTFTPLRPPAIPLAVRSPYLSAWQQAGSDGGDGGYLPGQWPTFWNGQTLGWTGMIRIDGDTYVWMGAPNVASPLVTQVAFEYTATKSVFVMDVAGILTMNITFLSPVEPDDLTRASLPYSYLNVEISSVDNLQHEVSIYTDISAEWVSGDRSAVAQWDFGTTQNTSQALQAFRAASTHSFYADDPFHKQPSLFYHRVYRQTQLTFSEINDQTESGYWYYATGTRRATHQSGADADVRNRFVTHGNLTNLADTGYRAINDRYPVFAFAVDLGLVTVQPVEALFQLSLHQRDAVQFLGYENATKALSSLWTSYFDADQDAISFFYADHRMAVRRGAQMDIKIDTDSLQAGGSNYSALTALATRQAFGSLEWTNTPDNPLVFMKEISSDGNVNTVDVIFPFHPIAIYLNPQILRYLLDPLFINQEAGHWPRSYTIHDIGSSFPNATGHPDGNAEDQPLEECGNMLIMTLAYAQRANNDSYLSQHYDILKQWTAYLVNDSLIPANQISTDDFAGSLANQTNLALKGMIGIEAFAQIAKRTGHTNDAANYTQIAHSYITQWQELAIAKTIPLYHTTLAYGENKTWGLLYNLWADRELELGLVPQSVYDMQSAWYPTQLHEYGIPLDTRHNYTKADWELFAAAVASDDTKAQIIDAVAKYVSKTPTNFAFVDLYETLDAQFPSSPRFINRPVIGGVFAPLALNSTAEV